MNTKKAKRYLAAVKDEKVGITEYGKTTIPGVPGVGMTDAADEKGKYGLEHTDGTRCDAKTPDSCPHNKKAQRADDLSGHEGSSANGSKVSSGNKKGADVYEASEDLHELEYEEMEKDLTNFIENFEGKETSLTFDFGGGVAFSGSVSFESHCSEDYDGFGKTADGNWARITRIYPSSSTGDDLKKDVAAFNEKMSEYGLAVSDKIDYDEEGEIERFIESGDNPLQPDLYAVYKGVDCGKLTVSDPEKFQAYKDSFKEGGSRSSSDLVERVKEDKEWKASPDYQEHLKEMKAKFPGVKWD